MNEEKHHYGLAIVLAFFMGGLIGALLSLLFAPQSGKRTRREIRRTSVDVTEQAIEAAHKAKETLTDLVDEGVERIIHTLGG